MSTWYWVEAQAIIDYNNDVVGSSVKDANVVHSALARAANRLAYAPQPPDAAELAAAYAMGFARSQGFNDGNKRAGWVAARLFLQINGYSFHYDSRDAGDFQAGIDLMLGLANGIISEIQAAEWFRQRIV